MPKKSTDWLALQQLFLTDPKRLDLKAFCETHKIAYKTLRTRAGKEKWLEKRDTHWDMVEAKATDKLLDLQATIQARDIAAQLDHLSKAKNHALQFAYGDKAPDYEDPGAAILAIDRITKLERLLLGESTENIKIDDMRAGVSRLVEAIRRKFGDDAVAELADEFQAVVGSSQAHTA
jgi:hypothetical protein